MTDVNPFIHAICEDPEDDTARLVYADWLEEHGQPERAEYIRVQIELAQQNISSGARAALRVREMNLLTLYRARWLAELPTLPGIEWRDFERGFVDSITAASPQAFVLRAPAVFSVAPIQRTRFASLTPGDSLVLAACPYLSRLTHLEARDPLGLELASALAESPQASGLRALILWDSAIGDAGAVSVANSSHLGNLTELVLSFNEIGPAGARALAASPNVKEVTRLVLANNQIGVEGARALIASPHLKKLQRLYLNANRIDPATKKALRQRFGARVCQL